MSTATPGPWEWWTSNSWRRLVHQVGGTQIPVLTPTVARDGHPDLMVSETNMALIAAAPDLLALAHQYASECAECGGTGTVVPWSLKPDVTEACSECTDIRAVIDKAEGRA
jgi:hypothetical protein